MEKHLLEFIQTLKADSRVGHFDEAATKQVVILKLLSLLGWDIFDLGREVCPEYPISSGERIDYSLKINNINRVFIEAKRIGEGLGKRQKRVEIYPIKLSKCAFKQGVKLAILTNGLIWHFYLPLDKNDEVNEFCTIDILQSEPQETVANFIKFLAKENISSGEAIQSAINTKRKGPVPSNSYSRKSTIADIQQIVSQHFGIGVRDMRSRKRTKSTALARQVGMFLTRTLTDLSLEEIGAGFGGKDHTTIMYAVGKIKKRLQEDKQFKEIINRLENSVEGSSFAS